VALERGSTHASLVDVLEHVLDKGIVIDAWVAVSVVGVHLLTIEARIVVASIQRYLIQSPAMAQVPPVSHRVTDWKSPRASEQIAPSSTKQLGTVSARPRKLRDLPE